MRRIAASSAGLIRVLPLFVVNGQIIATRRGSVLRYTHADHLGSASLQTDTNGNTVASTNVGHWSYGTVRSGSPSALNTDRTYTGQKQDSTGLLYYNARYYDPSLGQFLSPDTLVPDAGLVLDYNRYMYARGNPVKYTDPSGHCAVLGNGSPDTENDAGCWDAAKEWYRTFGGGDYQSEEEWLRGFASQPNITEQILRARLYDYWAPQYESWGIHHAIYNPRPTDGFTEVRNPELRMPGDTIVKAAVVDTAQCVNDVPLGCGALASDLSLTVATGAVVLCAGLTGGGCLAIGGAIGTLSGVFGSAVTTVNAVTGERGATYGDAAVSWTTTATGGIFGSRQNGLVGAGISLFQRMYDSWSSNR